MSQPVASVIVPTYNEAGTIETCLEALLGQTYDEYEIIICDNGSTDNTRDIVNEYPVKLVVEDKIQGSYEARNKGVEVAKGDILAFTDADCRPTKQWIAEGVRKIQNGADLIGGNVRFMFSNPPTPAELFDSISNMQIERDVKERSVAKTANLFVKQEVYHTVGSFQSNMISGGDVQWTKKATDTGFTIAYEENAEVLHPARSLDELLKKQYRVGIGQMDLRWETANSFGDLAKVGLWLLIGFAPRPPHYIKNDFERRDQSISLWKFILVFFVAWTCRIAQNLGRMYKMKQHLGR
ncbi:glycosyltransferase [Natronosalvus vescus]|uniref:glycosyltransferase n=1 Tax=Natronosalvus vescus TaxID=2953881 RepID=UPI0020900F50|nr:glycosyltransferase [Natronosalvus vescus]